jgi:hypothetical protein
MDRKRDGETEEDPEDETRIGGWTSEHGLSDI